MPVRIDGFCFDARRIRPNECFVALRGGARDGHDFIEQAAKGGASAALVEQAQASVMPQLVVGNSLSAMGAIAGAVRNQFGKPVVGITGSCGKTSTKEMLRSMLGAERTHATDGNWNNRIGVPMTLYGLDPDQQDFAVIEAGINQPGEMGVLGAMIRADLTIITNIGPAHLELLGTMDNVALEKAQLTLNAKPDSPVILPAAAFAYPVFASLAGRALVLAGPEVTVSPEPMRVIRYHLEGPRGGRTALHIKDGETSVYTLASPSEGICTNAALAIVAARELGVDPADILTRIEAWLPSSKRGRVARHKAQTFYIDCYNANPASMADALAAFRQVTPLEQARCYVLGVMNELGAEAGALHRRIGQQLGLRPEDQAWFVGPDALAGAYYAGALDSGAGEGQLHRADSVEKIKSGIADFEGGIFLKGSRGYALEKLLPETLQ